ncbi:MAG: glutathione S-transferase C-terminal domain-containing protein [Pseudomonadota bacterium]
MGMLVDGTWVDDADRSMVDGVYAREKSALDSALSDELVSALSQSRDRIFLIASASCPWSHSAVIGLTLSGLSDRIGIRWAGGSRVQGYGLLPGQRVPGLPEARHVHQFYTMTVPAYTGRATVPILWDAQDRKIVSNTSSDILLAMDAAGDETELRPAAIGDEIDALTALIFDGLSNAVYRAGKSERQDEYDAAVNLVFETMDMLEVRLAGKRFLFGDALTVADIRLFATLVRFDTVYATHFRCTRKRLVDYANLWLFTRRIYQMPGIKETVDFDEIRFGYYINDGSHNPHGIIGQQPGIDWENKDGLDAG